MISARTLAALAALAGLLLLPACGAVDDRVDGDGGDIAPMPESPPPVLGDPDGQRSRAATAATVLPNFGSVTQSSNFTLDGEVRVTADSASASFDGSDIRVTVVRPGRSTLILDPAEGSEAPEPGATTGGYAQRQDMLVDPPGEDMGANPGIAVAYVQTRWKAGDPVDFLALGYWGSVELDPDAEEFSGLAEVGFGTFVDGPELRGTPTLTSGGTATYEGGAFGLYAYVPGDAPAGSGENGLFWAMARLTADFDASTVEGCIGCTGGIDIVNLADDAASEAEEVEIEPETIPANVMLSPAPIGGDGTFRDAGVTVEIAGRTVDASSGAWGGRFSTIADAAGDPRLAAGTAGAEWTESDGSKGVFLGSWFADKR